MGFPGTYWAGFVVAPGVCFSRQTTCDFEEPLLPPLLLLELLEVELLLVLLLLLDEELLLSRSRHSLSFSQPM